MTFEDEYELAHNAFMNRIEELTQTEINRLTAAGLSEYEVGIIISQKAERLAEKLLGTA